jgi:phage shock protein B
MSTAILTGPIIIFLIFVAPLWLVLHYKSKKNTDKGLSLEEREKLNDLASRAQRLQERVVTLEKILDSEAPNWRNS